MSKGQLLGLKSRFRKEIGVYLGFEVRVILQALRKS